MKNRWSVYLEETRGISLFRKGAARGEWASEKLALRQGPRLLTFCAHPSPPPGLAPWSSLCLCEHHTACELFLLWPRCCVTSVTRVYQRSRVPCPRVTRATAIISEESPQWCFFQEARSLIPPGWTRSRFLLTVRPPQGSERSRSIPPVTAQAGSFSSQRDRWPLGTSLPPET